MWTESFFPSKGPICRDSFERQNSWGGRGGGDPTTKGDGSDIPFLPTLFILRFLAPFVLIMDIISSKFFYQWKMLVQWTTFRKMRGSKYVGNFFGDKSSFRTKKTSFFGYIFYHSNSSSMMATLITSHPKIIWAKIKICSRFFNSWFEFTLKFPPPLIWRIFSPH